MRRFVRTFASVWLLCQVVAVASPLALSCDRFGLDPVSCCDNLEPGQTCPMHHPANGDRTCRMASVCGHHDAALLTILPVGTLPQASPTLDGATVSTDPIDPFAPSALSRAERPDAPPPRG